MHNSDISLDTSNQEFIDTFKYSSKNYSIDKIKYQLKEENLFFAPAGITERQYSKCLDKLFGYRVGKLEQKLLKKYRAFYLSSDESSRKQKFQGTQAWIGLSPQVLQTPYSEIAIFLTLLKKFDPKVVIDLGAGYGRMGIVMQTILPNALFFGYEILDIRIDEARRIFTRLGLSNCEIIKQDILSEYFSLPKADIYFIYDFSVPDDLRIITSKLIEKTDNEEFFVVVRGEWALKQLRYKFKEIKSFKSHIANGGTQKTVILATPSLC